MHLCFKLELPPKTVGHFRMLSLGNRYYQQPPINFWNHWPLPAKSDREDLLNLLSINYAKMGNFIEKPINTVFKQTNKGTNKQTPQHEVWAHFLLDTRGFIWRIAKVNALILEKLFYSFPTLSDTRNFAQLFLAKTNYDFLNFSIYIFLIYYQLSLHHWVSGSSAVKSTTQRHKSLRKQTLFALVLIDNFVLFCSDIRICICKVSEELLKPNRDNKILS